MNLMYTKKLIAKQNNILFWSNNITEHINKHLKKVYSNAQLIGKDFPIIKFDNEKDKLHWYKHKLKINNINIIHVGD